MAVGTISQVMHTEIGTISVQEEQCTSSAVHVLKCRTDPVQHVRHLFEYVKHYLL